MKFQFMSKNSLANRYVLRSMRRTATKMISLFTQKGLLKTRILILYAFWSIIYVILLIFLQPLICLFVAAADYVWDYFPVRFVLNLHLRILKRFAVCVLPQVGKKYFSLEPHGQYVGCCGESKMAGEKLIPLHSVSLQGCAWMLPYHIGVCEVLQREKVVDEQTIWLGSSGGALIAAAAAMNLSLDYQLKFCISMGIECNDQHALGPAGRMSHYLGPHILSCLPEDAHTLASGKLIVSVTRSPHNGNLFGNYLVQKFSSRSHLFETLMASTYIPLYYETPVSPQEGAFLWDGGFSNNQPVIRDPETGGCLTTTVSPTAGKADISPDTQSLCNIEHLFPGNYDRAMNAYESGKKDAEKYVATLKKMSESVSK